MLKVGIAIPDFAGNQLILSIMENSSKLYAKHGVSPLLFVASYDRSSSITAMISHMQLSEIWGFNGNLITTDLYTTEMAVGSTTIANIIFYVWDFEWMRIRSPVYTRIASVYRHNDITLIAKTDRHAKAIYEFCGRKPDYVVEELNLCDMVSKGIIK